MNRCFVGDVASFQNGYAFKSSSFKADAQWKVVRIKEIKEGRVRFFDDTVSVDSYDLAFNTRYRLDKEDVVFALTGNPVGKGTRWSWAGRIAKYYADEPALMNQRVCRLDAQSSTTRDYLYYYFLQEDIAYYVAALAKGSANQGNISTKDLESIEIDLPDEAERQAVVNTLRLIDAKIALANRMNDCLSDMLDALFDEVVAEESCDWESASLLDIANYKNGLAMQRYRPVGDDQGLPVLKIRELGQGYCGADAERCRSDIDESVAIHDGDLIFSWSGTLLLDFWAGGDAGLNQHLFKVTSDTYPSWFYYMWTKQHMKRFISLAKDRATTMGHIKRSALQESEVLIPPTDRMEELTAQMQPFVDEMIGLKVQSRKLSELRDVLLPKLMSGEIDVSEIELPTQPNNHLSV